MVFTKIPTIDLTCARERKQCHHWKLLGHIYENQGTQILVYEWSLFQLMKFLPIEMFVAYSVGHHPPKVQERHNNKICAECNFSCQDETSTLWIADEYPRLFWG